MCMCLCVCAHGWVCVCAHVWVSSTLSNFPEVCWSLPQLWAPADDFLLWVWSPEQLDEFMVSAKKRRSLSFCQSWFPPRFKCWPPRGCQGWTRPTGVYVKKKKKRWGKWNVSEPCSDSVFTSCNYILLLSDLSRNMPLYFDAWLPK